MTSLKKLVPHHICHTYTCFPLSPDLLWYLFLSGRGLNDFARSVPVPCTLRQASPFYDVQLSVVSCDPYWWTFHRSHLLRASALLVWWMSPCYLCELLTSVYDTMMSEANHSMDILSWFNPLTHLTRLHLSASCIRVIFFPTSWIKLAITSLEERFQTLRLDQRMPCMHA